MNKTKITNAIITLFQILGLIFGAFLIIISVIGFLASLPDNSASDYVLAIVLFVIGSILLFFCIRSMVKKKAHRMLPNMPFEEESIKEDKQEDAIEKEGLENLDLSFSTNAFCMTKEQESVMNVIE
ncbi:MAG: hypothetical protein J5772_07800, partial [Clostridia bacterium]|nr:hypothetical protein [Clostridia bacterium]